MMVSLFRVAHRSDGYLSDIALAEHNGADFGSAFGSNQADRPHQPSNIPAQSTWKIFANHRRWQNSIQPKGGIPTLSSLLAR
jgi:hypothetical protein